MRTLQASGKRLCTAVSAGRHTNCIKKYTSKEKNGKERKKRNKAPHEKRLDLALSIDNKQQAAGTASLLSPQVALKGDVEM